MVKVAGLRRPEITGFERGAERTLWKESLLLLKPKPQTAAFLAAVVCLQFTGCKSGLANLMLI